MTQHWCGSGLRDLIRSKLLCCLAPRYLYSSSPSKPWKHLTVGVIRSDLLLVTALPYAYMCPCAHTRTLTSHSHIHSYTHTYIHTNTYTHIHPHSHRAAYIHNYTSHRHSCIESPTLIYPVTHSHTQATHLHSHPYARPHTSRTTTYGHTQVTQT